MKVNVLNYEISSGLVNMQKDLKMLENSIKTGEFFLRFYGWAPKCISLGRNQADFTINPDIDVIRRPTGGRALLHDNEITYCITGKIPDNMGVIQTYKAISNILINGFKNIEIPLQMSGERGGNKKYCMNISSGADISYKGKKFIGSAQFRKKGFFLQHGSIPKSINRTLLKEIFSEEINDIISLYEINPNISDNTVIEALTREFLKEKI